jgi:hypothetical protein
MLLDDMMKRIRFLFGGLVLIFGLAATGARAQSAYQYITFSVLGQYETATNNVPSDPTLTNLTHDLVMFTTTNIVKAIAVDAFGTPGWTNWSKAKLLRRINLVTGKESIYLNKATTNEVDVSSYFGGTYVSNFTTGAASAFPAAANNFTANNPDPYQRLYSGTPTNLVSSAGLFFISLNTTNLKMNLLGVNFSYLGNGKLTNYSGDQGGTNYSGLVENETISVIGAFSWTLSTNIFDVDTTSTNTFYSGPARGTVTVGVPGYSKLALPPDL